MSPLVDNKALNLKSVCNKRGKNLLRLGFYKTHYLVSGCMYV